MNNSMGNNIISKLLKDFTKTMIGIDSKIDNVSKLEMIQIEINKLIEKNNEYKRQYPNNKVPKDIAPVIINNNLKIKQMKEERDYLFTNTREQLKNNILKSNSPNSNKECQSQNQK